MTRSIQFGKFEVQTKDGGDTAVFEHLPTNETYEFGDDGEFNAKSQRVEEIDTVQFAAPKPGATGGDKIQTAIDDLTARGGLVFVGANGPDSVANNAGEVEDNVWEVTSEINTDGKNAVWIQGASPGWRGENSGTALMCSDDSVGTMLHYENGGFLDGLANIRVDGVYNADNCVEFGGSANDFQAHSVIAHSGSVSAFRLAGDLNAWIDNCWIEVCPGPGIVAEGMDDIWITNNLFFRNQRSILLRESVDRVLASGNRVERPDRGFVHTFSGSPATWGLLQFTDNRIIDPSDSGNGDHSVFKLVGEGTISDMIISNNVVDGGSQANHFVRRGSSITIEDSTIANNEVSGVVNA